MKKNRTMRVAALLLALTLITSCFVGGTMAKYTSDATGTATATAATWSIKVGATDDIVGATEKTFTFTSADTTPYETNSTTRDGEVKADAKVMAPGTWGYYTINLKNNSEVKASVTIADVTESSNKKLSNVSYTLYTSATEFNGTTVPTANATIELDPGAEGYAYVFWSWPFGENVDDTSYEALSDTLSIKVTATQVD